MAQSSLSTAKLHRWLERAQAGDRSAHDEMLRACGDRLERLARKMLGRFPDVKNVAETGDVLQNSLIRLLRALGEVRPGSVKDFFGLAAEQMRRELLDLARAHRRPGRGRTQTIDSDDSNAPGEPADHRDDADEIARWCAFHEAVERLPVEEREVVGLIFYHDWTQAQVAELFQVSERTVRRRWETALQKLHEATKGAQ